MSQKIQYWLIKYMKYMGGSGTCFLYIGWALSNCAMKWLASAFITGSSVGMPHGQNPWNSRDSIPLSLFSAHIFVSLFFHHTEQLIIFCHHLSK
jgi:hypothetical protein